MKKLLAFTLALIMIVSTLVFSTSVATAAGGITITYSFSGDEASKRGFAEGTISLKANDSAAAGTYYLYWADSSKALDGYRYIATMTVSSGGTATYKMLDHTAIPPKATQIIAFKSTSVPSNKNVSAAAGKYSIPSTKILSNKTPIYSYGAFSDPQLANDNYGQGKYPYDEKHWAKALETFAVRNVDFLVSSGDIVNDQNGGQTYAAEYQAYQKILAESSFVNPVYEANGNHDVHVSWQHNVSNVLNKPFVMGTGLDSNPSTIKANKAYFEITEPKTGDHFIFMAQEGGFYTNEVEQFSDAQLSWLEGLLKKYANDGKNIFIMEHANVEGWGSGDKASSPFYYDLGMKKSQKSTAKFISLMETYKKCVIITGHTHLELSAHLNYSDNNGKSAVMIHNSAIGGVRRLVNGSVNRDPVLGLSEGYFVDVYSDCVIFNGANLYSNEIMPDCTYIIPNSTSAIAPTQPPTEPTQPPTQPPTKPTDPPTEPTQPPTQPPVDKSNLKTIIDEAKAYTSGDKYTTSTWNSFVEAYDNAVNVYNNSKATQSQVDGAAKSLRNAIDGLKVKPTQPSVDPTEPPTQPPTNPSYVKYGDVNLDFEIGIIDATYIQRAVAQLDVLYNEQIVNADVDGDSEVSIIDATFIQRFVARNITKFPVETMKKSVATTGADDVASLLSTVKGELSNYYQYASFDQYMKLKKTVRELEKSGDKSQTAYNKLNTAYTEFKDLLGAFGTATTKTIDVYFTNVPNWSTVNVYVWSGSTGKTSWPGEPMTYVETNAQGQKVYKITLETGKYQGIIFNNGSQQTVDLTLSNIVNEGFYTTSMSGGKYLCATYIYGE